jgi:hypothetical protein
MVRILKLASHQRASTPRYSGTRLMHAVSPAGVQVTRAKNGTQAGAMDQTIEANVFDILEVPFWK